jgi:hypothetical protein
MAPELASPTASVASSYIYAGPEPVSTKASAAILAAGGATEFELSGSLLGVSVGITERLLQRSEREVAALRKLLTEKTHELGEMREVATVGKGLWCQANSQLAEEKLAVERELVATKLRLVQMMATAATVDGKGLSSFPFASASATALPAATLP